MSFRNHHFCFLIFLHILLTCLPYFISATNPSLLCHQKCGNASVSFPFGFSSSCRIALNCTNGKITIGEFPVRAVNPDTLLVGLEAKCNRSISTLKKLFTRNYYPTTQNGILLQNCTSNTFVQCRIPSIPVNTNFELLDCNGDHNINKSTINCFSNSTGGGDEKSQYKFLSYEKVNKSDCHNLLSSIWVEALSSSEVSLEVQVIQLGWWLEGYCQCSDNAECRQLFSPATGRPSYQCKCKAGSSGDGYVDGVGCQKDAGCRTSRFLSRGCGVGILVGSVIAGAFVMTTLLFFWCLCRRRTKLKSLKSTKRRINEATLSGIIVHPYKEIEKATNNFSDKQLLGTGAYGTVYSGKLQDSENLVAIKRLKHRDMDNISLVMNEIKLISFVRHPNLVRLLGCSIEKDEHILVYEFMPNGTLSQHLQRDRGDGLAWPVRLTIASETARAIAHLHFVINPPIFHRDIKSSNILLDHNCKSKLADFGLSRIGLIESSHISTAPQGTPGYVDPQYQQDFQLSDKSDVYSFGVVLVEIITAMKVVDFSRPQNEVNLAALAIDRIGKGLLDEIIDPLIDLDKDACTLSSVHKVAELAFRCLAFHRDMRPTMMEVAGELEQIRQSMCSGFEENSSFIPLSSSSSSFSSSNLSEKPLNETINSAGYQQKMGSISISMERRGEPSPISEQDSSWLSCQSSPSSSSLLTNTI